MVFEREFDTEFLYLGTRSNVFMLHKQNTEVIYSKQKRAWLPFIITILISGCFCFMDLSEYVTIRFLKQNEHYPFGQEGPVPWYYKNADTYANVNLFFGILFL